MMLALTLIKSKGISMSNITAIDISYVDNELYVLAIPSSQTASTEVIHYNSGNSASSNISIVPINILSPGDYTLSFVGVNWGGPSYFNIQLSYSDGSNKSLDSENSTTVGVVFTANESVTVG